MQPSGLATGEGLPAGAVDNAKRRRAIIPTLERAGDMKLSTMTKDWAAWAIQVKGASPATVDNYETTFQQFLAYLQRVELRDEVESFTPQACYGFQSDLGARGIAPNTIINKMAALSSLADFGRKAPLGRRGKPLMTDNPTKRIDRPKKQDVEIKIMRAEEARAFLELPLKPPRSIIRALFVETGLRPSSIAAANVGDVTQTGEGDCYLEVAVKSRGGGKRHRQFPLSPDVAKDIWDYLLSRGMPKPEEPLLVRQDGNRFSRTHLGEILAQVGRDAGITRLRVGPRNIRHLVNTWARIEDVDPYGRSKLLGHNSTASVIKYDHLIPGELHAARAKQRDGMRRYIGTDESH